MITQIEIKNFKSIVGLTMDLGRVNIIIGANGCGKTNILEAFAFASAASQQKLDNEFLLNRGIRVPNPQFLKPAFEDLETSESIEFKITEDSLSEKSFEVVYGNENKGWREVLASERAQKFSDALLKILEQNHLNEKEPIDLKEISKNDLIEAFDQALTKFAKTEGIDSVRQMIRDSMVQKVLPTYLIFSPQENILRDQNTESPIQPLGVNGEGLFQFLKEQWKNGNKELYEKLNSGLGMLDWFDMFGLPNDLLSNEAKLEIGDRYLKESLHNFDQHSMNEGFLFLLFYLTLFYSKETPSFFAIDNIEASFNPKLCTHLVKELIQAAKKNDKQVILTTHNPFVLDALDLKDNDQRLFVARRDIDGHTRISRILYNPKRTEKLSSVWMNGYIGGLPDNF